mmetsp:Transcript_16668/g.56312  ORF Transcript_16668/g.56312 Transcript_16668/m.56312 type:complete len:242 (-) Transcript_16668:466-1191(-)
MLRRGRGSLPLPSRQSSRPTAEILKKPSSPTPTPNPERRPCARRRRRTGPSRRTRRPFPSGPHLKSQSAPPPPSERRGPSPPPALSPNRRSARRRRTPDAGLKPLAPTRNIFACRRTDVCRPQLSPPPEPLAGRRGRRLWPTLRLKQGRDRLRALHDPHASLRSPEPKPHSASPLLKAAPAACARRRSRPPAIRRPPTPPTGAAKSQPLRRGGPRPREIPPRGTESTGQTPSCSFPARGGR